MRAKWHLQTMHISALQQFLVEGRGEDCHDQLSLHASQAFGACLLVFFMEIGDLTNHKMFYLDI